MQHIFSSGEIHYKENIKDLEEGKLVAEYLIYEQIKEGMEFGCLGRINGEKVNVQFALEKNEMEKILFKNALRILMQSDVLNSKWADYYIEWKA